MNLWYIRAQLASSLLVVIGRDRQFRKAIYAKEAIVNYCGLVYTTQVNSAFGAR